MGDWADNAYLKFFGINGDPQRKNEELELIDHHKLVAGGESLWKKLAKFIKDETEAFNAKTRPDFFKVTEYDYGNRIEVVAPMATLKCAFDYRVPQITVEHDVPPRGLTDSEITIVARKNNEGREAYYLNDGLGSTDIKVIGANLLNPLLV